MSTTFRPGEIVAILGLNGAGKTTLVRALSGTLSLEKGELHYGDTPFCREDLARRRQILFLPQQPFLDPALSVLENAALYLDAYDRLNPTVEDKILTLVKTLGLGNKTDQPVCKLSRGQAYKTALAALLAIDPEYWIIDEPFASGIDAPAINCFRKSALAARQKKHSVLFTTQLPEHASGFATRTLIIHQGKIAADLQDPSNGEMTAELDRLSQEENQ